MTSRRHQYDVIVDMVTYLLPHWYWSMVDSVCHAPPNFSMTLQTKILSTEFSDFLKQIIFLKSFISVFSVKLIYIDVVECFIYC